MYTKIHDYTDIQQNKNFQKLNLTSIPVYITINSKYPSFHSFVQDRIVAYTRNLPGFSSQLFIFYVCIIHASYMHFRINLPPPPLSTSK